MENAVLQLKVTGMLATNQRVQRIQEGEVPIPIVIAVDPSAFQAFSTTITIATTTTIRMTGTKSQRVCERRLASNPSAVR